MNKYLILLHHFWGSDTGVMTVVLRASSEVNALTYLEEQFKHSQNWQVQKITLIGVDTHA